MAIGGHEVSRALMLVDGMALTLDLTQKYKVEASNGGSAEDFRWAANQAALILRAGNYRLTIWDNRIWEGAVNGCENFQGVPLREDDLPQEPQLWIWAGGTNRLYTGIPNPPDRTRYGFNGLYVYPSTRLIDAVQYPAHGAIRFFWPNDPDDLNLQFRWEPGLCYGMAADEGTAAIMAASAFLKLPFCDLADLFPNHAARKKAKQENRALPAIRTIVLRRKEGNAANSSGHREYDCQFMVRNHWRKPNCRMIEQRPVYVNAYIKGDKDKPFRAARKTVFLASR